MNAAHIGARFFHAAAPARKEQQGTRQNEKGEIAENEFEILIGNRAVGFVDPVSKIEEVLEAR